MIKSIGQEELGEHDDSNIPCNFFIKELDEDDLEDLEDLDDHEDGTDEGELDENGIPYVPLKKWAKYELTGDNFMPRKGLADGVFHYVASTKEELHQLVKEKILPSYRIAFDAVTAVSEGKRDEFYYWSENEEAT